MALPHLYHQSVELIAVLHTRSQRFAGKCGLTQSFNLPMFRLQCDQPMTSYHTPQVLIDHNRWLPKRIQQNRICRLRPHSGKRQQPLKGNLCILVS